MYSLEIQISCLGSHLPFNYDIAFELVGILAEPFSADHYMLQRWLCHYP